MVLRTYEEAMALHLVKVLIQQKKKRAEANLMHLFGRDLHKLEQELSPAIAISFLFLGDQSLLDMLGYFQHHSFSAELAYHSREALYRFLYNMATILAAYGYWLPNVCHIEQVVLPVSFPISGRGNRQRLCHDEETSSYALHAFAAE